MSVEYPKSIRAALLVWLLALTAAGCAVESRPLGLRGRNLEISLGKRPDKSPATPPAALPAAMPPVAPRAGSNLEPRPQALAVPTASAATSDKQALSEVLEHIQTLGQSSPEEQARLIEDLKSTDPAVWPMLAQYSRIAAARRRAEQGDPEPIAAAPRRGSAFAASAAQPAPAVPLAHADQLVAAPHREQLAGAPVASQGAVAARPDLVPARLPGGLPVAAPATPMASAGSESILVRAATTPGGVVQAAAEAPLVATPAGVVTAGYVAPAVASAPDFKAQLGQAIAALEQQSTAGQPVDPQREAQLRMLYLLAGRKDDALRPIAGLPETQQEFWSSELFGLAAVLDAERQPDLARRAAEAVDHLEQARTRLRESGSLLVRNMAFCTEVRSYGITKPFETYQFSPGQEVLLYAELENFKSESTDQGYHTALKSSYEILDGQGRRVASHEFPLTEEHCQNARRDFFIRYFLRLPEKPGDDGKHTLRLTIEDTLAHKIGQASIDFTFKRP